MGSIHCSDYGEDIKGLVSRDGFAEIEQQTGQLSPSGVFLFCDVGISRRFADSGRARPGLRANLDSEQNPEDPSRQHVDAKAKDDGNRTYFGLRIEGAPRDS